MKWLETRGLFSFLSGVHKIFDTKDILSFTKYSKRMFYAKQTSEMDYNILTKLRLITVYKIS